MRVSIYNDASTVRFSKKINEIKKISTERRKETGNIEDFSLSELNDDRDTSNIFTLHKDS